MDSTIHARLRSATRAVHLELERHLALLSPDISMVRYTRIIALLYGFYRPLEAGLVWLEQISQSGLRVERIVTSACETFSSLINWTRAQGLNHEI
jgi:hypothetical protein